MNVPRIASKFLAPIVAVGAVLAVPVLTPAASAASVTPASSPTPISPAYCSGDVCTRVYLPANAPNFSKIVVRTWARNYTFYGHFELQVPGIRRPFNSADATNHAGGGGHWFTVPNNDGRFTVHAWQRSGPRSWRDIGTAGFNGSVI